MANTILTTTGYAVDIINDAQVSAFDLMHMPDVSSQLTKKYPAQVNQDLTWLEEIGAMELATQETVYEHEEDLLFPQNIFIASTSTAGLPSNQIQITLAAESHYRNGANDSLRVKDTVELDNGTQAVVMSKNVATPFAHTAVLQSINVSKGDVRTSALVGGRVSIVANIDTEGNDGYRQSILPQTTLISNQLQSFDEKVEISFEEMGNKTWVDFADENGSVARMYFNYAELKAYERFNAKRARGMFLHYQNDAANTFEGQVAKTTRGLIPDMEDRSFEYYYVQPDFQTFDDIEKFGKKTYQNNNWNILAHNDFLQAFKNKQFEMFKNGAVIYGEKGEMEAAQLGFKTYQYSLSGATFNVKPLDILNDPSVTDQAGKKYQGMFLALPAAPTVDKGGKPLSRVRIKYKEQKGEGARKNIKIWELGAYAQKATNAFKTLDLRYTSHEGILAAALDVCILGKKIS